MVCMATGFPVGPVPVRGSEAHVTAAASSLLGNGKVLFLFIGLGNLRTASRDAVPFPELGRRDGCGYRFSCGSGSLARCPGACALGRLTHWGHGVGPLPVFGSGALFSVGRGVGPLPVLGIGALFSVDGSWAAVLGSEAAFRLVPRISFASHDGLGTLVHDAGVPPSLGGPVTLVLGTWRTAPVPPVVGGWPRESRISFAGHARPVTLVPDAGSASFPRDGPRVHLVHGTVWLRGAG
jgi:hypothetical protein